MQREKEKKRSSNEMAALSQASSNYHADEDYIDMEVISSSSSNNFLCYSISSPPQSRDFEFQMCSVSKDKETTTTSPADELFYKGKLLPLHLPPRLLMVQNLLQNSKTEDDSLEENFSIPFINTSSAATTNTSTPLESCNVSPSESCRVSSELNPDEYFFEWSNEMSVFINDDQSKKSWTRKKLKQIKKSSLGQKLKASRAYLMSLFSKSTCSDEFCAKAACNVEAENISKGSDCLNKYMKVANKSPFGKIDNGRYKSIKKEMIEDVANSHRKSFSGAIQRHSPMKSSSSSTSTSSSASSSSSSSFSFSSIGFYNLQLLKRSSSANSEIESSIEGAIAHCKQSQSQQLLSSRKNVNEAAVVCSLSASKIPVCGGQERPGVCSILI